MGRSGVELASAPIRAMSKASGLVFDHWVVLCVIFAVLAMAFLIFQITWETRESRRLDELKGVPTADTQEKKGEEEK